MVNHLNTVSTFFFRFHYLEYSSTLLLNKPTFSRGLLWDPCLLPQWLRRAPFSSGTFCISFLPSLTTAANFHLVGWITLFLTLSQYVAVVNKTMKSTACPLVKKKENVASTECAVAALTRTGSVCTTCTLQNIELGHSFCNFCLLELCVCVWVEGRISKAFLYAIYV